MSRPHSGAPAQPSFAERKNQRNDNPQPTTPLIDGTNLMRPIDWPPPGDVTRRSPTKATSRTDLARQRSNLSFFEDAFATGPPPSPARARVHGDAIVMAEVKTNVIITDEFTFTTQLAYHLSSRYHRPVTSIAVTLHHGACMFFAGSFDPTYIMAVYALPDQLRPTSNKRNAALIQGHMAEALGVGADRGVVRFVGVPEECLASGGRTVAGEVEEVERGVREREADVWGRGKSLARVRPPTPELTPPGSADGALPQSVCLQQKAAKRKKSFVASIFRRSSSRSADRWS